MQVFFSNRVEKLYQSLKTALFSSSDPFARRLIVVSNQTVKSWLMLTMAKDPDLRIAAGIEITYLNEAVEKLAQQAKVPNHVELSLAIEIELWTIIHDVPLLHRYLKMKEGQITRKGERRLTALADSLSRIFMQYGLYGAKMTNEWQKSQPHWQAILWRQIKEKYNWSFPSESLQRCQLSAKGVYQVHFFSLSFVSRPHLQFLIRAAEQNPICFYMLSPCQSFWSDLSRKQQFEESGNFLLSNLGRLGREMVKSLEESDVDVKAEYVLSEAADESGLYSHLLFEDLDMEHTDKFTLLTAIQSDMLLLRNAQNGIKTDLSHDDSLQIHAAANRKREVEILYDQVIHAMYKKGIAPSDIIVMAPSLMDYEPYVKTVFNQGDVQIPYQFLDNKFLNRCPLVQGFMHLLKLPLGRWDSPALMQLLRCSAFQKYQQLDSEEIDLLEELFIEAGISWGEDAQHRDQLLHRDHGLSASYKSETGTWSHAMRRLLASLATAEGKEVEQNIRLDFSPLGKLEASKGPLLGKFLNLLHSLKDDLDLLSNGSKMTWFQWCDYLKCLLQAYFGVHELSQEEEEKSLWIWLDRLRRNGKSFKEDLFSFDTVRRHLEAGLQTEDLNSNDAQLNAICFCSMLPMRAIPAKMICLIGMDEGVFPRKEVKQSLNLLSQRSDIDYIPSQIDYDRYLFLEAILSARQCFYLSYLSSDESGSKISPPSILISELISYLDNGYSLEGQLPSDVIVQKHPFYAFDKGYFSDKQLFSYSQTNFLRAQAFYGETRKLPHRFIPEFAAEPVSKLILMEKIEVKQLAAFARNPLKTYFNKTLGIYISDEEELKSEESFLLSRLDLSYLKKASLGLPIDMLLNHAGKKGMLPPGTFGDSAIKKIEDEVQLLADNLAACGVDPKAIFKIHLSSQVEVPFQDSTGDWHFPPLHSGSKQIIGVLPEVSGQGLIFHGKDDKTDVLKTWPQLLIYLSLIEQHGVPFAKALIFTKSGKIKAPWFTDSKPLLEAYLDYCGYAQHHISPLIPELTYDVMYVPEEQLGAKIQERLQSDFSPIYNDYLAWLRDVDIHLSWKKYALNLYDPLYQAWYPKRGS